MTKFRKKFVRYRGFSFIEGILAAFIVTVGMIAVVQLMTSTLLNSYNSRNQIMAAFLAQEGAEIVRNIRDNAWAQGHPTFDNASFPADSENTHGCRVDMSSISLTDCPNGAGNFKLKTLPGKYFIGGGGQTSRFMRKILINYLDAAGVFIATPGAASVATSANVYSIVTWGGSFPAFVDCNLAHKCVYVMTNLRKWGEQP